MESPAMALNATELMLLQTVVQSLKVGARPVRVLSLGYPDLLLTRDYMAEILGPAVTDKLPIRKDSEQIARDHGRDILRDGVFESVAVFAAMGCILQVLDIQAWTGTEIILDMNDPAPEELKGRFDLIIDPGLLEHVFNIGQGFKNVAEIVRVGGFIYHQNPVAFVNHGFYSLSPTLYIDFYTNNGFTIKLLGYFKRAKDQHGFLAEIEDLPHYDPVTPSRNMTGVVLAQKREQRRIGWPVQHIYGGGLVPSARTASEQAIA